MLNVLTFSDHPKNFWHPRKARVIQTRFQTQSEYIPKNAQISKTFRMLNSLKSPVDPKSKFLKRAQNSVGSTITKKRPNFPEKNQTGKTGLIGSAITKKRKKRPNFPEKSQTGKTGLIYNIEYYLYKFTLKISALFTKVKVLAKDFTMPKISAPSIFLMMLQWF